MVNTAVATEVELPRAARPLIYRVRSSTHVYTTRYSARCRECQIQSRVTLVPAPGVASGSAMRAITINSFPVEPARVAPCKQNLGTGRIPSILGTMQPAIGGIRYSGLDRRYQSWPAVACHLELQRRPMFPLGLLSRILRAWLNLQAPHTLKPRQGRTHSSPHAKTPHPPLFPHGEVCKHEVNF